MSNNDDFFGGSLAPSGGSGYGGTLGGTNPGLTASKEYGQFGSGSRPPVKSSAPVLPIVVGVVLVALVAVAGLFGYRMLFGATQIDLPDQLIGLDRIDPQSQEGQVIEKVWDPLRQQMGNEAELHVGGYQTGNQVLMVVAAETGTGDPDEVKQFFDNGITEVLSQVPSARVTEEDAGGFGGTMKCFEMTQSGVTSSACIWMADDNFGAVVAAPSNSDIASTTRSVRSEITH